MLARLPPAATDGRRGKANAHALLRWRLLSVTFSLHIGLRVSENDDGDRWPLLGKIICFDLS